MTSADNRPNRRRVQRVRVLILGGGFSGIGMAIACMKEGISDFVIVEKSSVLGGTWRDNTYPGCACDVPSQLYSYSYAPNPSWSRVFAEGPEIQEYLLDVADRFGVVPYVHFDTEVTQLRWDNDELRWHVETSQGQYVAQFVVGGLGPLHIPKVPDFDGLDEFEGTTFHSARWDHEHDLSGRRVAVVGTGSSSIQLVPEIAGEVEHLTVFQRTPSWVLPKPDHAIPPIEQAAFKYLPGFQKGYRNTIYGLLELLQRAQRKPERMQRVQRQAEAHLRRQVSDPELRARLTPSFTIGCKRLLLSNTYYPALQRENVTLAPAVTRITKTGVVGADGVEHECDTIVFATGFHATDPPWADWVFGRDGASLQEHWQGSPEAYLGTTMTGFPNLFFMVGPNLGNGHSSVFVLIEAQAKYITKAIHATEKRGADSVEVRKRVQDDYNESVQEALAGTVWNAGGCASWYIDDNGKNSSIYPWSTLDLRRRLSRFDPSTYHFRAHLPSDRRGAERSGPIRLHGAVVAITGAARGIGLATARAFTKAGATVCLGDIDGDEVASAAAKLGPHARAYQLDVTDRASFSAFVDDIESNVGPIDVFVGNAGVMPTGVFLDETDAVARVVHDVNVGGLSLGMKLVLPGMIRRGQGHVVNVASMAGRIAVPGLASYVASKHAAVGLSAAVREEIRGTGVTISTVMPGAVRTRLSAGIPLEGIFAIEPETVAQAIVKSCRRRPARVVVPKLIGLYPALDTLVPDRVMSMFKRSLAADRVLTRQNRNTRASYEAAISAQDNHRAESPARHVSQTSNNTGAR